jgi:hypothetical protein
VKHGMLKAITSPRRAAPHGLRTVETTSAWTGEVKAMLKENLR